MRYTKSDDVPLLRDTQFVYCISINEI